MIKLRTKHKIMGLCGLLWVIIIILCILFTSITPPVLYSFHPVNYCQIDFDESSNILPSGYIYSFNTTSNSSMGYLFELNTHIKKIIIPEFIYPYHNFKIEIYLNKMQHNAHRILCDIQIRDIYGPNMVFSTLCDTTALSNNTTKLLINVPNLKESGIMGNERTGPIVLWGINRFTITIQNENLTDLCYAHFPIEVKSDAQIFQISNGITVASIIIGVVTTAVCLRNNKKRKGDTKPTAPIPQNRTEEMH